MGVWVVYEGWNGEYKAGVINTMKAVVKREGGRRAMSHQELPFLLPVVALGVCGHMGLSHHTDEVPLLLGGLQSVPHRLLQLFSATALPVLLD